MKALPLTTSQRRALLSLCANDARLQLVVLLPLELGLAAEQVQALNVGQIVGTSPFDGGQPLSFRLTPPLRTLIEPYLTSRRAKCAHYQVAANDIPSFVDKERIRRCCLCRLPLIPFDAEPFIVTPQQTRLSLRRLREVVAELGGKAGVPDGLRFDTLVETYHNVAVRDAVHRWGDYPTNDNAKGTRSRGERS